LGRILQLLDELALRKDTVVVFTSDHGDLLGSHGRFRKGQPLEESVHIPFVVRYPDVIPQNLRLDVPLSTVDWMPTLLNLLNQPVPSGVQGRDCSALLQGETMQEIPDAVFLEGKMGMPDEWRGLRTQRHLIAVDINGRTIFMFDMKDDPFQRDNLAGRPEHRELESSLRRKLREWQERVGDPLLTTT
jgi:arylsulfatase A-like enzyme